MKTKYTVSKTGWGREEESHETTALVGAIDKDSIAKLLDSDVFFANKKDAADDYHTPIKRNVKITVVITDIVPKGEKK